MLSVEQSAPSLDAVQRALNLMADLAIAPEVTEAPEAPEDNTKMLTLKLAVKDLRPGDIIETDYYATPDAAAVPAHARFEGAKADNSYGVRIWGEFLDVTPEGGNVFTGYCSSWDRPTWTVVARNEGEVKQLVDRALEEMRQFPPEFIAGVLTQLLQDPAFEEARNLARECLDPKVEVTQDTNDPTYVHVKASIPWVFNADLPEPEQFEARLMAYNKRDAEYVALLDNYIAEAEASEADGQLLVQLAGCLTAAEGATKDPAQPGDYGWSPAYQAVLDLRLAYDELRLTYDELQDQIRAAVFKLATQHALDTRIKDEYTVGSAVEPQVRADDSKLFTPWGVMAGEKK